MSPTPTPFAPSPYAMTPGQAAEAPKKPHLYIGNLSPRVTDHMLGEIFAVAGPVVSAKIIQDRNFQHGGYNYGFVEYKDMASAEQALGTLNARKIFDAEIRVNWAYQGQGSREDTQHHFHVFVGDLSPEVNDDVLGKAFCGFASLSEARVMWDMNSGKSRGYGFLSFREKNDAEAAIASMNGEWLGSRTIRVNWANQKTQTGGSRSLSLGGPPGGPPGSGNGSGGSPAPGGASFPLSFEHIAAQTPEYNTTVYVGNLIPYTTQADLIPLFQSYGYIVEIRMQADRGFAFVKLDSHANAALAIANLQNSPVHGRPIKCSWGKDRQTDTPGYGMYSGPGGVGFYGYEGVGGGAGAGGSGQPGMGGLPGSGAAGMGMGMPLAQGQGQGMGVGVGVGGPSPPPGDGQAGAGGSSLTGGGGGGQNGYEYFGWGGYYAPNALGQGQGHGHGQGQGQEGRLGGMGGMGAGMGAGMGMGGGLGGGMGSGMGGMGMGMGGMAAYGSMPVGVRRTPPVNGVE